MPITETTREGGGDSVKTLIDDYDTSAQVLNAASDVFSLPLASLGSSDEVKFTAKPPLTRLLV